MSVEEIAAAEGEDEPLFAEIRRRGEVREIPLLYHTIRQFAEGKLNTVERLRVRRVHAAAARPHRAGRRGGGGAVSAGRLSGRRSAAPAAPARIYVTDCEGPLTRNDNAQEIAERFVPDGAEFFARLSKYDDFLVDVVRKPGYNAGDTLRLIPPFFKAFHVTDEDVEEFSAEQVLLVPRALKTLDAVSALMPAFIISTSYTPYLRALCELAGFPFDARALHGAEPGRLGDAGGRGGVAARVGGARVRAAGHRVSRRRRPRRSARADLAAGRRRGAATRRSSCDEPLSASSTAWTGSGERRAMRWPPSAPSAAARSSPRSRRSSPPRASRAAASCTSATRSRTRRRSRPSRPGAASR